MCGRQAPRTGRRPIDGCANDGSHSGARSGLSRHATGARLDQKRVSKPAHDRRAVRLTSVVGMMRYRTDANTAIQHATPKRQNICISLVIELMHPGGRIERKTIEEGRAQSKSIKTRQ